MPVLVIRSAVEHPAVRTGPVGTTVVQPPDLVSVEEKED